ncbi:MAG: isochorismatase-like protein [Rhizobium sp.]|nr:isochorismatase-like protein [Rhizobium sp.]
MKSLGEWRHICVDMQRMFAEDTPWHVKWMERISSQVIEVARRHPERTIFTRFVPPENPMALPGMWRDYYRKWRAMTGEHLPAEMVALIPQLARFVPPAHVLDKMVYSPWFGGGLHAALSQRDVATLVISGGETDLCVLATVLGGIDHGYRIVLLDDAVCSGADETHDAALKLLGDRFSVQLELMSTEAFLAQA